MTTKSSKEQVKKNVTRQIFFKLVEFFRFIKKKNSSFGGGTYGYVGVATWFWVFYSLTAEEWTRAWNEYGLVKFIIWELLFDPLDEIFFAIKATLAGFLWPIWWFIHNEPVLYLGLAVIVAGWLFQKFARKSI
jgi:hypothetical protein